MRSKPVVRTSLVAVAVAGMVLAGCSSGSSSSAAHHTNPQAAAQKVCDSRTQLTNAVSMVRSDVSAGNVSKAKTDLSLVKEAVRGLRKDVDQLAAEQKKAIAPDVNKLKTTISGLKKSTSVSALSSGISSVTSQVQSLQTEIQHTLSCS